MPGKKIRHKTTALLASALAVIALTASACSGTTSGAGINENLTTTASASSDNDPFVTNIIRYNLFSSPSRPNQPALAGITFSSPANDDIFASRIIRSNLFDVASVAPNDILENLRRVAFSQMGKPYVFGGTSPSTGFDCSGFTGWVYRHVGVALPRSSREQFQVGTAIPKNQLRKGDLVFFRGSKKSNRITHVGIYLENGKFIHSPRRGYSISVSSLSDPGWVNKWAGGRRYLAKK